MSQRAGDYLPEILLGDQPVTNPNNRWLRRLSLILLITVSMIAWGIMAWLSLDLWRAALT